MCVCVCVCVWIWLLSCYSSLTEIIRCVCNPGPRNELSNFIFCISLSDVYELQQNITVSDICVRIQPHQDTAIAGWLEWISSMSQVLFWPQCNYNKFPYLNFIISKYNLIYRQPDSLVGTTTELLAGRPENQLSILGKQLILLLVTVSITNLVSGQPHVHTGTLPAGRLLRKYN